MLNCKKDNSLFLPPCSHPGEACDLTTRRARSSSCKFQARDSSGREASTLRLLHKAELAFWMVISHRQESQVPQPTASPSGRTEAEEPLGPTQPAESRTKQTVTMLRVGVPCYAKKANFLNNNAHLLPTGQVDETVVFLLTRNIKLGKLTPQPPCRKANLFI